ncbi:exosortase family protein XrtF [Flavobacterium sp. MAH-1]|uniref:Exosortase family protein XrtF n=1 Tax=Flavobacterium agri TaxID=2743471 RepID=A0A7Y8Y3F5_9FLAO|nr:exosortase family protein XrtF [Flavobacterium agri]NUY81757.1 exosortase family protein XrtF [Flavobacterium agri]NYA71781.1 exosortase family protein XrtF [Flavobacterium agri]
METLKQYKPFFIFLLKFFAVYAGLTLIYQTYLNSFNAAAFEVDDFTKLVADQTKWFTDALGYHTEVKPHLLQPSIMFILDGTYVARVVEGCNALSVIILFAAFVVAFKGEWKKTLCFILGGTVLIHILNIVRIGLLSIALLHYPKYEHILHGVIFPAIIYGVVFLLWVVWVNKFSQHGRKKE